MEPESDAPKRGGLLALIVIAIIGISIGLSISILTQKQDGSPVITPISTPKPDDDCGDGICGTKEDLESCPADCPIVIACANGGCEEPRDPILKPEEPVVVTSDSPEATVRLADTTYSVSPNPNPKRSSQRYSTSVRAPRREGNYEVHYSSPEGEDSETIYVVDATLASNVSSHPSVSNGTVVVDTNGTDGGGGDNGSTRQPTRTCPEPCQGIEDLRLCVAIDESEAIRCASEVYPAVADCRGDLNGDGKIDWSDIELIHDIVGGAAMPASFECADYNQDDEITDIDEWCMRVLLENDMETYEELGCPSIETTMCNNNSLCEENRGESASNCEDCGDDSPCQTDMDKDGFFAECGDCNDNNPGIKPGAVDVCNGADDDCDGTNDEDHVPTPTTCGLGACASTGQLICKNGVVIDTCTPGSLSAEICDGLDNDCDGGIDEDLGDTTCGVGACQVIVQNCVNGAPQTCVPKTPGTEVCDGTDNDCDGRIDEDCKSFGASITVYAGESQGSINPFIYGNNVVWDTTNGLWDNKGTTDPGDDTLNMPVVNRIKEIEPTIVRFPGGGYVHRYAWKNAIGPRDRRPKGKSYGETLRSNDFGSDEFMLFVDEIGAEPWITVNTRDGTAKEAAAWVAYMNGRVGDNTVIGKDGRGYEWKTVGYWAGKRAENGHPEPYGVEGWEVGNEDYFFAAKIGYPSGSHDYYQVFNEFAREMKRVDPDIETAAVTQAFTYEGQKWWGPQDTTNFDYAAYHSYLKGLPYKYEQLYSGTAVQTRDFEPVAIEAGTYRFAYQIGSSGKGWRCEFLAGDTLLSGVGFSTDTWIREDWTTADYELHYTNEVELQAGSRVFKITCYSGSGSLYLRDIVLQRKVSDKFVNVEELRYSSIEEAAMALWKESKGFYSFLQDYRDRVDTKIAITEFNSWGFDLEFVDLRDAIFIADMLIQMAKSDVEVAQYWLLTDYHDRCTNLIDTQDLSIVRPDFLVYKLFRQNIVGNRLRTSVSTPGYAYDGSNVPYIEPLAVRNPDGRIFIAVINKHLTDYARVSIRTDSFTPASKADVYVLNGPALERTNEESDNIVITQSRVDAPGSSFELLLEPHSLTLIGISPEPK